MILWPFWNKHLETSHLMIHRPPPQKMYLTLLCTSYCSVFRLEFFLRISLSFCFNILVSNFCSVPIAEMGPPQKKVCKTPQTFNIGFSEKFQKPILFKIKFINYFINDNFFDFELESWFFFDFWNSFAQKKNLENFATEFFFTFFIVFL